MKTPTAIALLTLVVLVGCKTSPSGQQSLESSLLATDRAFSRMSAEQGTAAAFHHYLATNAVWLPTGSAPVHGRDAVRALLASDTGRLTWEPTTAEVARSGDLGYTYGFYEFRGPDTNGVEQVRYGKYVTIWRRHHDGTWKGILDTGNPGPPPPASIHR